jgi:hypothetical protein
MWLIYTGFRAASRMDKAGAFCYLARLARKPSSGQSIFVFDRHAA